MNVSNPRRSWLERNRIGLTRLFVLVSIVALVFLTPPIQMGWTRFIMVLVGYSLIIVAALGRVWCTLYIGNRKMSSVCTEGPYSLARHPLYFFSFVGLMGVLQGIGNWWVMLGAAPIFVLFYAVVILREERWLSGLHGEAYAEYCNAVPNRFFPRLRGLQPGDRLNIAPQKVLHSLLDASGFLWAIVGLELYEFVHHVDPATAQQVASAIAP